MFPSPAHAFISSVLPGRHCFSSFEQRHLVRGQSDRRAGGGGRGDLWRRSLRKPSGGAGHDPKHIADDFPDIEFHSRREGAVVGDHSVSIHLPGETLTLAHHAEDRRLFARGAYDAGQWLIGQPPGKYTAMDWIRGKKNGT
jgi:hypothetical protein